jgi:hypothetical protein
MVMRGGGREWSAGVFSLGFLGFWVIPWVTNHDAM